MAYVGNRHGRLSAWPLAAFLFGLLAAPGFSIALGALLALLAVPIAFLGNLRGNPIRYAWPWTGNDSTNFVLFVASTVAAIVLQLVGFGAGPSVAIALIPSIVILRGGRAEDVESTPEELDIEEPAPSMSRQEMLVGLRAMIADQSTSPENRERAMARLKMLEP
jgi:hypothetical protein